MSDKVDITLLENLKRYFGFTSFKGNQEAIIHNVLQGNDTFVLMPTGGGKSLCYQLPALVMDGTAIVISPLIALMKNQVDAMRSFIDGDSIAHFLNSSLSKSAVSKVKQDIVDGKTKLLYVAPESLTKEENIQFLKQINVSFYAIDEAHCISEWGHDFRPEYRRIRPIISEIGKAPLIALTATATPKVQHDIQKNLGMLDATVFKSSFNRPNLYYEVRPKQDATKEIIKFIRSNSGKSGIIYCLSRKKVEELANALKVNGIKAVPYHAGLDSNSRSENQDKFLMEETDVVVATIAFGMGIDKPDVRYVIHYDIPKSLEGYYQETGRAGRDGGEGRCITFYSYKDIQKLEKFMHGKPIAEQEIGKQLLQDTVAYAESSVCRRKSLLLYFGEDYTEENCGNCDNCLNPKELFDGKDSIVHVVEVLTELKEKFKADHVVNFLVGNATSGIKTYKHHHNELFGSGKEKDEKYWNGIIRQMLIHHLLTKDIENYGLLKISPMGHQFAKTPHTIMMAKDHDYGEGGDEEEIAGQAAAKGGSAADETLFALLKDLRRSMSKKVGLPPFVIFQDPSLEDMSIQYPITMDELQNIAGVGAGKAKKYGTEFIELIKKYVDENEIDRPQDMVVKSVANKSLNKVFIIQSIDKRMDFEDIAKAKGMELSDLLTEMEAIVNSGTRINIDYYINEMIDEDKIEEVFDYFKTEAKSESVKEALDFLGEEDYSEEEIRLLRIKFISEMGN